MKILIVFTLCLITLASAQEKFKYPVNNSCILADFDAEFEMSFTLGNATYSANFSLPAEKDIDVDGACAGAKNMAILNLTMAEKEVSLIFTIQKNAAAQVSADLQVILINPEKTFPGLNYSSLVTLDGTAIDFKDMGRVNNSYLCNSVDNKTFSSNQSDVSATASILFSKVQIQGFNVKDGKFSTPNECAADKSSTTSTTMATTTPSVIPSGTGNYTLQNHTGGEVCVRLVANITVTVSYVNKEGKQRTVDVMVPAEGNVTGMCGEEMIEMTIDMTDSEAEVEGNVTFTFLKDKDYSFIEGCEFELSLNDTNETISRRDEHVHDALALSTKMYQCNEEVLPVEKDKVTLKDINVQAFDVKTGFSKKSLDCKQAPPKTAPSQNYTVADGNVTCISMQSAISLKIKYLATDKKNKTETINFEKDEPAEGSCSGLDGSTEYITVFYKKNDFQVMFEFANDKKASDSLTATAFNYYVQNVSVTYTISTDLFPGAAEPGKGTVTKTGQKLYQTPSDKYYKCASQTTIELDDSVSLITQDLRLIAYNSDVKTPNLFGDNVNECTADTETNSIVPIAVGAALAGLVVIVLIAYLIGRRRNHKGYESV